MGAITVEGTVTPSAFLKRGDRRTVERTEFVDKLIRKGYVKVVETPSNKVEAAAINETKTADPDSEPARNATREEWAAWLSRPDVAIPFDENDNRSALIDKWDAAVEAADNG